MYILQDTEHKICNSSCYKSKFSSYTHYPSSNNCPCNDDRWFQINNAHSKLHCIPKLHKFHYLDKILSYILNSDPERYIASNFKLQNHRRNLEPKHRNRQLQQDNLLYTIDTYLDKIRPGTKRKE